LLGALILLLRLIQLILHQGSWQNGYIVLAFAMDWLLFKNVEKHAGEVETM
jgi:hypothetical protein